MTKTMTRTIAVERSPLAEAAARVALAALPMFAAATVQAQAVPDAGRLLEDSRQTQRPLQPPSATPPVLQAPARPTVQLPEGATVQVKSFRITGAVTYPADRLAELVRPWVGRSLDLKGLNEAAGALTRHYQSAGHVLSYAYLPAQKVEGGVIEIAVLEGKVDAVQVVTAQEVRLRDEVVQAHTDGLTKAQPVLQADVERKLLLLNDIPGVVARAAFTPGASTGTADVVVSVAEEEPLGVRVELDNHGSRSTGEFRAGLGLQVRNVSGLGDSTQLQARVSNGGGLVSGSIATQLPIGGDGFKVGANLSRLTYFLGGNFEALGAVGVANVMGIDASYPAIRRADANLTLKAAVEHQRLNDEKLELIGQGLRKQNDTYVLSANGDLRDGLGGGGVTAVSASLTTGDLAFIDRAQVAAGILALDTDRVYRKASLQLARQQALFGRFSLYGRWLMQYSGGNLDSSEKLGLAGPAAVRAYAPGEASVDHGRLWSLELRYGVEHLGGQATLSLFHDQGTGLVTRRPLAAVGSTLVPGAAQRVNLRGSGFGLQWSDGQMGLSASVAWRGPHEPQAEGGDPKPRLYLQLFTAP